MFWQRCKLFAEIIADISDKVSSTNNFVLGLENQLDDHPVD
jgi:hypothetical protein